jgi:hypothetical protein
MFEWKDTWREIKILLTKKSKEVGSITFEVAKREIAMRDEPLDHRNIMTIDLLQEYPSAVGSSGAARRISLGVS